MPATDSLTIRRWMHFCLAATTILLLSSTTSAQVIVGNGKWAQAPEPAASQVGVEPVEQPMPTAKGLFEGGPNPTWVWGPNNDANYLISTTVKGKFKTAKIKASCDNIVTLMVNGKKVGSSDEWQSPIEVDITSHLGDGDNTITADVKNAGGVAAFLCKIVLVDEQGKATYIVSDKTWQATTAGKKLEAVALTEHGKLGTGPWGNVFSNEPSTDTGVPRDTFVLLPGFKVEKLFTVPKEELGSWVCITTDPKGRILASDQGGKGICRITPSPLGATKSGDVPPTLVEHLDLQMTGAQGMLHAFGHLYFSVNGGPGSGLYRAKYLEATDNYGPVEKLKEFRGGGEHGPHALRLSPDGKSIYVIAGNHTDPPFNAGEEKENPNFSSRIPTNWGEDLLLPRMWDANGHARGRMAPGGWIASTDPEGKTWEIFSIGYRNPYDMAFNADGELFAYDADMEWDFGSPWYRPTRVVHATSGSEFGWRSGTGKWPTYYVDSLPPLVDIGPGSPVGVEFGYGTKFPAKYQKALYLCDWTFGTMYAIHIEPNLSSYKATKEEFLSRTPLPLTDVTIGHDGAMYFTIGGRGTQSELYRVTYAGKETTDPVSGHDEAFAENRATRNSIEALHGKVDLKSLPQAELNSQMLLLKSNLSNGDRFLRAATVVAYEKAFAQLKPPVESIKFSGRSIPVDDLLSSAVMLSRLEVKETRAELLGALQTQEIAQIPPRMQLDYLRALSLVFIRLGEPSDEERATFIAKLDPLFPVAKGAERYFDLNRELCQMLVYLKSPTVIEKTIALMKEDSGWKEPDLGAVLGRNGGYGGAIKKVQENQPDKQRIWYAFCLRVASVGWTPSLRKDYFEFMKLAHTWSGGNSYQKFLSNMEDELFDASPNADQILVEAAGLRNAYKTPELPKPTGPGKDYTLEEVRQLAERALEKGTRDFENGEKMFKATRCVVCHRFGGDGGSTGPDLTQLAGRFNIKDLTEAIVDPSKVVSDQYKASTVITSEGKSYTGRILSENEQQLTMLLDPEDSTKIVDVKKSDVEVLKPSDLSLMPAGLLKALNEQEVQDLMAYLLSRGDANNPAFKRKRK
ncbi:MAG: c-type cytochrome [Planctomycetaceae bacterium]